ncbi:cytochrome c oxidase assembly protein [Tsuneonella suprasediminis]|uniref:Cytochrome c oxidase assembly protein CtaG n=1 Tax=Tsuneonella suprasediminis TaxID=2306996 RepID=A0A419QYL9_9SPHN|nr:cytochrome c oxidase assembly protein [Tsuneonella suprasediminis]RJX65913.1 cytochrome c oxidase assembly protein [Tsuneonella suprasediminis]
MAEQAIERSNLKVGIIGLSIALAMLALGYAAVPLYRLFCQVTGFAGTTQRADESKAAAAAEAGRKLGGATISVRFDGNVDPNLPWTFRAEQTTQTVTLGERKMAFYYAKNNSDQPITGAATFNVSPDQTGFYFNKIQCFCFTEQTLQPGQEVVMPVLYYVDPSIRDDPDAAPVEQVTLSYTFHRASTGTAAE